MAFYGLGNLFDVIGTTFKLPEFGLSEGLAGGRTANTGMTPQSQAYGFNPAPTLLGPSTRNSNYNVYGGTTAPVNPLNPVYNAPAPGVNTSTAPTGNAPTGGSSYQEPDFNSIYAPVFQSFDQQQAAQEQAYQQGLASIDAQATLAKKDLELAKSQAQTTLGNQTTEVGQTQQSALSQARQLFNELSQSNQARFGASSGTGPAAQEILSRATAQQMGGVNQAYTNQISQIRQQENRLNEFSSQELNRINSETSDKKVQAFQNYNQALVSIGANRAMAESDKAAKIAQVRENYNAFLRELEAKTYDYQIQLKIWNEEQKARLTGSLANVNTLGTTDTSSFYNTVNPAVGNIYKSSVGQANYNPATALSYARYAKPKQYDIYGNEIGTVNAFA